MRVGPRMWDPLAAFSLTCRVNDYPSGFEPVLDSLETLLDDDDHEDRSILTSLCTIYTLLGDATSTAMSPDAVFRCRCSMKVPPGNDGECGE